MKLHEIISANDVENKSILIELLIPYKKQLLAYYTDLFSCEPVLMVTSISNACQYGKIVPSNEFQDYLEDYVNDLDLDDEDREAESETINWNSIMLCNL